MRGGGVFYLFKWRQPAFAAPIEESGGGGVSTLCRGWWRLSSSLYAVFSVLPFAVCFTLYPIWFFLLPRSTYRLSAAIRGRIQVSVFHLLRNMVHIYYQWFICDDKKGLCRTLFTVLKKLVYRRIPRVILAYFSTTMNEWKTVTQT